MKLDVKNLAFEPTGETDYFNVSLENYKFSSDVTVAKLESEIMMTRLRDSILAEFKGTAALNTRCDRCLEDFELNLPLDFSREFFLEDCRENSESLLVSKAFEISIKRPFEEEIILTTQIKKLCNINCKGLCSSCGNNLNLDACQCGKEKNQRL